MSPLFSAVARRASPIVSKFGPCPLPFSPSSLIRFNPWLASTTPRSFSSSEGVRVSANERMKRMLEAAIRRREEFFIPKDFPFEIVCNSNSPFQKITLKRNVFGEDIEVVATEPDDCDETEEGDNEEDDDSADDAEVNPDSNFFQFTVNINKGGDKYMEFSCSSSSKGITVEKMHLQSHQDSEEEDTPKYTRCLDETLQGAALKYLAARGIDSSLSKFVLKYTMSKDREHLDWLKRFKDFVTT